MYRYTAEILIAIAAEKGASDVHLIAGLPPKCRIDGQIRSLTDEPLSYEDCEELGRQLAGEHVRRIDQIGQLDFPQRLQDGASGSICFARRVRFPLRCAC